MLKAKTHFSNRHFSGYFKAPAGQLTDISKSVFDGVTDLSGTTLTPEFVEDARFKNPPIVKGTTFLDPRSGTNYDGTIEIVQNPDGYWRFSFPAPQY